MYWYTKHIFLIDLLFFWPIDYYQSQKSIVMISWNSFAMIILLSLHRFMFSYQRVLSKSESNICHWFSFAMSTGLKSTTAKDKWIVHKNPQPKVPSKIVAIVPMNKKNKFFFSFISFSSAEWYQNNRCHRYVM